MATQKPGEWASVILSRFEDQLPVRVGIHGLEAHQTYELTMKCLIEISRSKFSLILVGLTKALKRTNESHLHGTIKPNEPERCYYDTVVIILTTLERCLSNQAKDSGRFEDSITVKKLLRELCHFYYISESNANATSLKAHATKAIFALSHTHFTAVFSRFLAQLQELTVPSEECPDFCDIELIQHVDLDTPRLIKLLTETNQKFRSVKKQSHIVLLASVERAIWNWVEYHPEEFAEIQRNQNEELAKCCEVYFDILDSIAENKKTRSSLWPLQIVLLVLCPKVLEEVVNADFGAPCSTQHLKKKAFIDAMKKGVTPQASKQFTEASVIACVKLCKLSTYIPMTETSVVFLLVQSVLVDLKAILFNPAKPFSRGQVPNIPDIELMIDCMVAFFRITPHSADAQIVCLELSSPPTFHFVVVNSLLRIVSQPRQPWWPQIDLVYSRSEGLRNLFTDTLNKATQGYIAHTPLRMIQSLSIKPREGPSRSMRAEDGVAHKTLLLLMVRLIHADPMLLLNVKINNDHVYAGDVETVKVAHDVRSSTVELINGLVSLVHQMTMPDVAQGAMEALLALHAPDKIEIWNPEAPVNTFWDLSSQVMFSISQKLIQHQIPNYTDVLKWMKEILICRNKFLQRHSNFANVGSQIAICRQAHVRLEVVFYMYLWSIDLEAVLISLSCFGLLCVEVEIRCGADDLSMSSMMPNFHLYQELAQVATITRAPQSTKRDNSKFPFVDHNESRNVLQHKIMELLRATEHCDISVQQAWEETFRCWENTSKSLQTYPKGKCEDGQEIFHRAIGKRRASHQSTEHDLAEQINEWATMTWFLLSLGGACLLRPGTMNRSTQSVNSAGSSWLSHQSHSFNSLTSLTPSKSELSISPSLASSISCSSRQDNMCPVVGFIGQLLRLLVCCNEKFGPQIQKNVKDLLGMEMSPQLFPILFDQIRGIVDNFFDRQGQVRSTIISDINTQFIEHVILIIKAIFESKDENGEAANSEYLGATNVENMLLGIVRYVRNLDLSDHAIYIKTKFCSLVEIMMRRRDDLSFRQEMKFRNKLVEYLTDWVLGSASPLNDRINVTEESEQLAKLSLRELDTECMQAITALLKDLPLQPEESERGDLMEAKSALFLKYFTLFMHMLNDCLDKIDVEKLTVDLSSKRGSYAFMKLQSLRNATVQAMSNLLSANIDAGLTHSIDLGYNGVLQTRTAFMEVLTQTLIQGAAFDTLAETATADRYDQLVALLTIITEKGELPIAMALANVVTTSQLDELAKVLVTIFDAKNLLSPLLWNIFYREVELTDSMQTLFRGNSLGSKIMAFCFKIYGTNYLHNLLNPLIEPLLNEPKTFEVDKARLGPNESIDVNRNNLLEITGKVFNAIMGSVDRFPLHLRSMCHCLYQVLCKRFPLSQESNIISVGTVIFLRYINPAIVSPRENGIVNRHVPNQIKRGLMLMSKILQNIANHVEFSKEQHMLCFNHFLRAHVEAGQKYFIQIASECESLESLQSCSYLSDANVAALHRLLWNHQEKIGDYLSASRDKKNVGRLPFDKMAMLLAYLGPPEHKPVESNMLRWSIENMTISQIDGYLFNKENCVREDDIKVIQGMNIFYQLGKTRGGRPVFYFIARRFKDGETKESVLVHHVTSTMKPYLHAPFDLIVDVTHVNTANRFSSWLIERFFFLTTHTCSKLHTVYIYNCNSYTREFIKINDRTFTPLKNNNNIKVVFADLKMLKEAIAPDQLKLPGQTMSLEEDLKIFTNALRLSHKDTKISIKIGPSTIQITTAEKFKVLSQSVILNDVFYASEIEEVCLVDDNQFTLSISNEQGQLSFIHTDCDNIVQAIIHIRNRWELTQPNSVMYVHQQIRPKDVPGTLLNMALLNLGSCEPNLRTAAYNQICAIVRTFGLRVEDSLLETQALCIPSNNTIFIKDLSENLATNEPRLTLEFLEECLQGFHRCTIELKHLCLEYMTPWLKNLIRFCKPEDRRKKRVAIILESLTNLTLEQTDMFPSIQAKIWSAFGDLPEIIDMVLDLFMHRCLVPGAQTQDVDIMANTAVALAAANNSVVAEKVVSRLCRTLQKTSTNPTASLGQHMTWNDITIMSRYLLMLSFNNRLDVGENLPYLFHAITMLMCAGPMSMRCSIHGLTVNLIHSLCTCSSPQLSEETKRKLRIALDEFSVPKFYAVFGISKVKSAALTAFRSSTRFAPDKFLGTERVVEPISPDPEPLTLPALEVLTDALLEILESCMNDMPNSQWLNTWSRLARNFAFCYNPSLQPRALIVFGCISKSVSDRDVKLILRILIKALDQYTDPMLIHSLVVCLTRIQPLLQADSPIPKALFWVAVSVLQLDDQYLYSAGLALLEQNLHTLTSQGVFDQNKLSEYMLTFRAPLELQFKQLDHAVGLSFRSNFHFALIGHLIKGFRHDSPPIVSRTSRIITTLLSIVARPGQNDKFVVNADNVAYLTALVAASEEVRARCHVQHTLLRWPAESCSIAEIISSQSDCAQVGSSNQTGTSNQSGTQADSAIKGKSWRSLDLTLHSHGPYNYIGHNLHHANPYASAFNALHPNQFGSNVHSYSHVTSPYQRHDFQIRRSASEPVQDLQPTNRLITNATANSNNNNNNNNNYNKDNNNQSQEHCSPTISVVSDNKQGEFDLLPKITTIKERGARASVSNETNVLLDPVAINDTSMQALILTVLATLVKYTSDESETRVLYQYLAEGSVVFPKVFPVIHALLDQKINHVLQASNDQAVLKAIQSIIQNMLATDDPSQQQLHFLQSCGFGGLWRFAGPFTPTKGYNMMGGSSELFVNCLVAIVDRYLPKEPADEEIDEMIRTPITPKWPNLSGSMNSLVLSSPADRDISGDDGLDNLSGSLNSLRRGSSSRTRSTVCARDQKHRCTDTQTQKK